MNPIGAAISFTEACLHLKISNKERGAIIMEAGGIDQIADYLSKKKSQGHLSEAILLEHYLKTANRHTASTYPAEWRAVSIADKAYPRRLRHIDQAPAILFTSGENLHDLNGAFVIAIIGSRSPSIYGLEVTKRFASQIARLGVPVVSGGARGIDAHAHRTALDYGGHTFAVLGCGLDIRYPPEHRNLFCQIEKKGALLTEYVPGTKPMRQHFPARNRIISGLCDAVLVTEASVASGTLITAGFAADQGRDVLAVPGSVLTGKSRSCHNLIRDGAMLAEEISDIPGLVDMAADGGGVKRKARENTSGSNPDMARGLRSAGLEKLPRPETKKGRILTAQDKRMLEVVENAPRSLTAVCEVSGLSLREGALRIAILQKEGYIHMSRGLYTRTDLRRL
ncbi:MAG TPA: DNA-processing protein DprA [Clostridia bacterium]|nr:DNA-processing protein DprA [Clostridia bacterium]